MPDTTIVITTGPDVNIVTGGGASAYQIWLDAGNTGTQADFLESLEGAQGPAGATGPTGPTGAQGPQGDPGSSDALGTGFVNGGGTGTIPDGTVATVGTGSLTFSNNDIKLSSSNGTITSNIDIKDDGFILKSVNGTSKIEFFSNGVSGTFNAERAPLNFNASKSTGAILFNGTAGTLEISNPTNKIYFSSTTGLGVEYIADYSATIITNPTSFTDVTSVNLLKQTPVSYDNASAPNNCIFYSTTVSKLCYKDPGGTVNPLY